MFLPQSKYKISISRVSGKPFIVKIGQKTPPDTNYNNIVTSSGPNVGIALRRSANRIIELEEESIEEAGIAPNGASNN